MTWWVNVAGTWQKVARPTINVAGVNQRIKTGWVNVAGVWQKFFSAEDDLSMFTGTAANAVGYTLGGFGTLTPTTLGDGTTVAQVTISTHSSPTPFQLIFSVRGYPGAINQNYITSIIISGISFAPGDVNFSNFSGGSAGATAQWTWQNAAPPAVGVTVPVAVVRT